ncbi:MAG: class I SAM-dependent methyltransferase [Spirochaeta sp.]|nr:class I SAM-dependent methyltransferase [Spirochaeta sp.]
MDKNQISNNETLDKVYTAENHDELMDAYKSWAGDYDNDVVGAFGYVAHIASARALDRALGNQTDAVILDAGSGTGLVGEELKKLGYTTMDALDYSREMLEESEKKGIYRKHIQADMSKPLDLADNTYDAVVCTGTFTYGHVNADAFDELVRVTRPGGVICFTIREGAYKDYGYRRRMVELEHRDAWELLSMYDTDYLKNEGTTCKMCSYRVL